MEGLRLLRRCNRRQALGRVALAFACGLVLLVGCGGGDGSSSDRVEPVPIRGGERLAWNQAADSIAQLKSLTFRLYIDGTESTLAATQCDEVPGPLGFECSGMLPPISSGQHLLELTSVLGGVESQRSPSLLVIVTGSATTTGVSLEQSAPLSQPMSCATDRPAVCYAVQLLANGLGAVSALTPIPDGRVMFIEDGQQIRVVARDAGSSLIALPAEPGRQLTGLAIDSQFEKSRSAFVAWSELARGAPGLNITRYREVENLLGEGATIATALPTAPDVATPIAIDDEGLVYVASPRDPNTSGLNSDGIVMRFNRDGLVPRSNQNASPIVAEGYGVPRAITIDRSHRTMWLAGSDHERLGDISSVDLRGLSRGAWPGRPVAFDGISPTDDGIESVAIAKPATADTDLQLLVATAGRLREVNVTARRTVSKISDIPVGDGYFVRVVATDRDGSPYVSATTRDGSTSVLKLTKSIR